MTITVDLGRKATKQTKINQLLSDDFPLPNNLINIKSLIAEFIIWNLQWVPR